MPPIAVSTSKTLRYSLYADVYWQGSSHSHLIIKARRLDREGFLSCWRDRLFLNSPYYIGLWALLSTLISSMNWRKGTLVEFCCKVTDFWLVMIQHLEFCKVWTTITIEKRHTHYLTQPCIVMHVNYSKLCRCNSCQFEDVEKRHMFLLLILSSKSQLISDYLQLEFFGNIGFLFIETFCETTSIFQNRSEAFSRHRLGDWLNFRFSFSFSSWNILAKILPI